MLQVQVQERVTKPPKNNEKIARGEVGYYQFFITGGETACLINDKNTDRMV